MGQTLDKAKQLIVEIQELDDHISFREREIEQMKRRREAAQRELDVLQENAQGKLKL